MAGKISMSKEQLDRETDITQVSQSACNISSYVTLLQHSRNDEVKFHNYIHELKKYARQLVEIEFELKRKLREKNK
jgi:hypothetical protein